MGVNNKDIHFAVVEGIMERLNNAVKKSKSSIENKFQTTLVSMHLLALRDTPDSIENFIKANEEFYITEAKNNVFYGIFSFNLSSHIE